VSEYQHKCTLYTLAVAPPTGDNVIPFRKYFTVLSAQYSTAIDLSCQEQFSERETDEPARPILSWSRIGLYYIHCVPLNFMSGALLLPVEWTIFDGIW